ncbi:MAG TPA: histidine--tRNA ligase [Candidatus Dormibacteraeota bacterium]
MPPSQPIKAARGVRDVMPGERAVWDVAETAAREVARAHGYQELQTPILELAALIERGVGQETDAGGKELYRLVKRGSEDLVLRPEATAGVVRAYFQHGLNQGPQPARLFTLGPMFRYNAPQLGRYRQFHQLDVEAIGDGSPAYDVECIEIAMRWMGALGLRGLRLELNSIGDQNCRPAYIEKLVAYYRPLKDKLHPDCQRRLETNPLRLLDCKEEQCAPYKAKAPRITDNLCAECAAAFAEVRSMLDAAGVECALNPYLVRGLDYYTRTVFEVLHEALGGAQNSLGGGGRYDGLAREIGYPDTPAVGFAAGFERVVMMMAEESEEVIAPPAALVLVVPDGPLSKEAAEVGRLARNAVPTAVDYSTRSLKAKMRAANRLGPRWVAIFNAEESARRVVQLKEMAGGEQREVGWDELPNLLEAELTR